MAGVTSLYEHRARPCGRRPVVGMGVLGVGALVGVDEDGRVAADVEGAVRQTEPAPAAQAFPRGLAASPLGPLPSFWPPAQGAGRPVKVSASVSGDYYQLYLGSEENEEDDPFEVAGTNHSMTKRSLPLQLMKWS